jgi:hypothetical protein
MGEGYGNSWHVPVLKNFHLRADDVVLMAELTLEQGEKQTVILDHRVYCR